MSTSAQVTTAWDAVFIAAAIENITEAVYNYAITEDSEIEITRFYHNGKLNFIEFYVLRSASPQMTGQELLYFTVTVNYYRAKDTDGTNWKAVRDFFETLWTQVKTTLGSSWSSTVDFGQPQTDSPTIEEVTIGGEMAWKGSFKFYGTQQISV